MTTPLTLHHCDVHTGGIRETAWLRVCKHRECVVGEGSEVGKDHHGHRVAFNFGNIACDITDYHSVENGPSFTVSWSSPGNNDIRSLWADNGDAARLTSEAN